MQSCDYSNILSITKRLLAMYGAGIDELQVAVYPLQDPFREESAVMELIGRLSQGNIIAESHV